MLDINYIRENKDTVKKATIDKGFDGNVVDEIFETDVELRKLITENEMLRAEHNKISTLIQNKIVFPDGEVLPSRPLEIPVTKDSLIKKASDLKEKIRESTERVGASKSLIDMLLLKVPNPSAGDVKVGTEKDNEVVRKEGEAPKFTFTPKDHVDLGVLTDTIDIERGSKVAQSGFYYLKGDGAMLEMALINYAMSKLAEKGFTPVVTPNVAKERNVVGCGFQSRSEKERQVYKIEGEDLDLVATAEITLVGMHTDEVIAEKELPKKYVGFSSCYRQEIGSYGKDVRGILRVHEFRKVEMVVFCKPEESDKIHDELLSIEEEIWKDLGIAYQVIKMATGDLGNAASRKYDIEAWMPSQERYREVTSTSNTTDFQTRRLNIKYKKDGKNEYLHSLNGTIIALARAMIAIYENFQNEDGSISIPEVLHKWMGKEKILVKG